MACVLPTAEIFAPIVIRISAKAVISETLPMLTRVRSMMPCLLYCGKHFRNGDADRSTVLHSSELNDTNSQLGPDRRRARQASVVHSLEGVGTIPALLTTLCSQYKPRKSNSTEFSLRQSASLFLPYAPPTHPNRST